MPFKGRLEEWYAQHQTIDTYFKLIILTAWVIVFPRLNVVWSAFPDLPFPDARLASLLGLQRRA